MTPLLRLPGRFVAALAEGGPKAAVLRIFEYLSIKLRQRGVRAPDPARFRPPPVDDSPLHGDGPLPVISLLMPVHDTPADVLEAAIRSVVSQTYPAWELCICDDASSEAACLSVLESWRGYDPRLKIARSDVGLHIAGATNRAALHATGEFVGFLDHDDLLAPHALRAVADAIRARADADVLYTDEDKLERDGRHSEPYLKPDWSPEHLESVAYLLHLMVVRKALFLELGGLRERFSGAQDYDLALRATRRARAVVHVPTVAYHWRKIAGSAAAEVDAKPQALIRAREALEDHLQAKDQGARAVAGLHPGVFRACWSVDPAQPVTLLMLTDSRRRTVPGRGDILLVKHAVDSILAASTFKNVRLLVLDNGRMPGDVRSDFAGRGVQVATYETPPGPFNFPLKMNAAFALVETEDVVILNDDIEVVTPDWIEALLAHSRRDGIGAVGARLLYPNDRIQHAGIALGVCGPTAHVFHNQPADQPGYCAFTHVTRNYSAVTGAVLATRMSHVRAVGGFDTRLAVDFNDVDFCLRLGAHGLRTVWTPHATLHHFEGATLSRSAVSRADEDAFVARWGERIRSDPFYNVRLPHDRLDMQPAAW